MCDCVFCSKPTRIERGLLVYPTYMRYGSTVVNFNGIKQCYIEFGDGSIASSLEVATERAKRIEKSEKPWLINVEGKSLKDCGPCKLG